MSTLAKESGPYWRVLYSEAVPAKALLFYPALLPLTYRQPVHNPGVGAYQERPHHCVRACLPADTRNSLRSF